MSAQLKHYLRVALESCVEYFAPRFVLLGVILLVVVVALVPPVFLALGLVSGLVIALLPIKKNLKSATLPS